MSSSSSPQVAEPGFIVTEGWMHHFQGESDGTVTRWAYDPKTDHFSAEFTRSGHYEAAEHGANWESLSDARQEALLQDLKAHHTVTAPYQDAKFSDTWPAWAEPVPTATPEVTPSRRRRTYLGYFAGPDFSINPDQTGAVQIWYQRFEIEVQNRLAR